MVTAKMTPVPDFEQGRDSGISSCLRHERRHLWRFFEKLECAGIVTIDDLAKVSLKEVFEIAKTSKSNQERFVKYINEGFLDVRPS